MLCRLKHVPPWTEKYNWWASYSFYYVYHKQRRNLWKIDCILPSTHNKRDNILWTVDTTDSMSHELTAITHHSIGVVQSNNDFQIPLEYIGGTQDLTHWAFLYLEWGVDTIVDFFIIYTIVNPLYSMH